MSQNYLKAISIGSAQKVYHNKGCHYAQRMSGKYKMTVTKRETKRETKRMGYRPCKCCNSMNYHFRNERRQIEAYAERNHMRFSMQDGIFYVKTDMGIWKMIYSRDIQKFVLYHGNQPYKELDIRQADTAYFHRQVDEKFSDSMMYYMTYIHKHDCYRRQVEEAGGNELAVRVNRKYAKQRTRRLKRQSERRLDNLFAALEKENAGYAKLACW